MDYTSQITVQERRYARLKEIRANYNRFLALSCGDFDNEGDPNSAGLTAEMNYVLAVHSKESMSVAQLVLHCHRDLAAKASHLALCRYSELTVEFRILTRLSEPTSLCDIHTTPSLLSLDQIEATKPLSKEIGFTFIAQQNSFIRPTTCKQRKTLFKWEQVGDMFSFSIPSTLHIPLFTHTCMHRSCASSTSMLSSTNQPYI